jgi:hypothetical protein
MSQWSSSSCHGQRYPERGLAPGPYNWYPEPGLAHAGISSTLGCKIDTNCKALEGSYRKGDEKSEELGWERYETRGEIRSNSGGFRILFIHIPSSWRQQLNESHLRCLGD